MESEIPATTPASKQEPAAVPDKEQKAEVGQSALQGQKQGQKQSALQGQKQGQKQSVNQAKSSGGQTPSAPAAMDVLKKTPVPPVLCDWLVCMRKPALSMQYSVQKRHVPDLDAEAAQGGTTRAQEDSNGAQAKAGAVPSGAAGVNSDTMGVKGDFTIRYFDLAAGVLALTAVGCLIKTCCFLKRKIF